MDSKNKAKKVAKILVKSIFNKGIKDIVSYVLVPVIGAAMMSSEGAELVDGIKEMMTLFSNNDKIV